MTKFKNVPLLSIICLAIVSCAGYKNQLVKVDNGDFKIKNSTYDFIGANYWQGMNLGAPIAGDQQRLIRELDAMQELGITNLRVLAASEGDAEMKYCVHPALQTAPGVYSEDLWQGLDFLLSEMKKRNMKAVMVLGNFWTWSGGFPQYLKWSGAGNIPFPQDEGNSWDDFADYSKQFYSNKKAQDLMNRHIEKVLSRKNSYSGVVYKKDPTIMAWQLANEPRGYNVPEEYLTWTKRTASFIKSLDKNHLVCLGTEGNTAGKSAGIDALRDNDNDDIDYITMHIWAQNWGWFDPSKGEAVYQEAIKKTDAYWDEHVEIARKLNKPIILEEFGVARDDSSYDPEANTLWRDRFYKHLFDKTVNSINSGGQVKGLNFWTYSGEGRPTNPGEFWEIGDAIIGDPAHELQGWYGVYDKDESTLEVVKNAAERVNQISE